MDIVKLLYSFRFVIIAAIFWHKVAPRIQSQSPNCQSHPQSQLAMPLEPPAGL